MLPARPQDAPQDADAIKAALGGTKVHDLDLAVSGHNWGEFNFEFSDGKTLQFYAWEKGDVDKELLPNLRKQIDSMVAEWPRERKDAVLAQTADSFKYGGALLQHISAPRAE